MNDFIQWLEASALAEFMQQSEWAFPAAEALHVVALSLVLGTIAIVDLRLVGLASRRSSFTALAHDCLPYTWAAFATAAVTGALMFVANAQSYVGNTAFRLKMLLMLLAGINMAFFELRTVRGVAAWDREAVVPVAARAAGVLSLAFWIAIVGFGRWIGFTKLPY
ncbi:MAG TPA: DUF6644 family protein [Ramlibacter sp.]|uniref:DUF6644 family protein n=1 Tax=Ramlibacter sp. TaxID=1917967 RepID=UPI002D7F87FD|nr:DUF6644 family protein [Ramlibacter sp.]HET8748930.1 DUF6644 family protein [Ramlibacter sp.]